jgi:hypothetical protein
MRENEVSASSCVRLFARRPVIYFLKGSRRCELFPRAQGTNAANPENKNRGQQTCFKQKLSVDPDWPFADADSPAAQ